MSIVIYSLIGLSFVSEYLFLWHEPLFPQPMIHVNLLMIIIMVTAALITGFWWVFIMYDSYYDEVWAPFRRANKVLIAERLICLAGSWILYAGGMNKGAGCMCGGIWVTGIALLILIFDAAIVISIPAGLIYLIWKLLFEKKEVKQEDIQPVSAEQETENRESRK